MTTTASERTTVTPSRWSLDRDGSSDGFTGGSLGMIRRPAALHVKALLKNDAGGRRF